MPSKECSAMDERLRFVARLLDRESMTDVRREFEISRKAGYKILARYREHGRQALSDRSRRPRGRSRNARRAARVALAGSLAQQVSLVAQYPRPCSEPIFSSDLLSVSPWATT